MAARILGRQKSSDQQARLAQSVEHETLNLRVVGSSPTLGVHIFGFHTLYFFFSHRCELCASLDDYYVMCNPT